MTSTNLTPGAQYRVTTEPTWGRYPQPTADLAVGDVVTPETGYVDRDGDVRVIWPRRGSGLGYVRASALVPVTAELAPGEYRIARTPVFHLRESERTFDFHGAPRVGDVVVVTEAAGAPYGDDVCATGLRHGWRISASCLEPVAAPPAAAREPLTFSDALEKATAHLGTPSSAADLETAGKLAELLVEVSK